METVGTFSIWDSGVRLQRMGCAGAPRRGMQFRVQGFRGLGFRGLGVWGFRGLGVWGFGGLGV